MSQCYLSFFQFIANVFLGRFTITVLWKILKKKIFFFYFTEICVIQTFMVFLFMNKKKIIRFHKIYFYLNINNKFNFTRVFFFKTLLYWVKAVWPRTLSNPWMYRSQRKAYILTKHDLINEENYFLIRKQDLNMQSLSTGIYMFSIALAFFFYI